MGSTKLLVLYLILFTSQFANVISDGDHAHAHDDSATAAGAAHTSPGGSATVHTTSSGGSGEQQDSISNLLSGISPEILSSLAGNPQIAQALSSSGVDLGEGPAGQPGAPPVGGGPGGLPGGLPGGFPGGFPGGIGGFGGAPFPFFGGPFKNLHVSGDFGLYYPYVEKIIIVVGGGILLLVILALLTKGFAKGGLFNVLGSSLSEALAGSASVDIGPIHKSVAGSAAVAAGGGVGNRFNSSPQDIQLTQRVYDGLDQRF